jgi:hypothetical protein
VRWGYIWERVYEAALFFIVKGLRVAGRARAGGPPASW